MHGYDPEGVAVVHVCESIAKQAARWGGEICSFLSTRGIRDSDDFALAPEGLDVSDEPPDGLWTDTDLPCSNEAEYDWRCPHCHAGNDYVAHSCRVCGSECAEELVPCPPVHLSGKPFTVFNML